VFKVNSREFVIKGSTAILHTHKKNSDLNLTSLRLNSAQILSVAFVETVFNVNSLMEK